MSRTDNERWRAAFAAKQRRDAVNEVHKEAAALASPGKLRAGGKAALRNSQVAADTPLPDNRRARRVLARYGTHNEIREFIAEYEYDCEPEDFISRYCPGGRKTSRIA